MKMFKDSECIYLYESKGEVTFRNKSCRKARLGEMHNNDIVAVLTAKEYDGWFDIKFENGRKLRLDYSEIAYIYRLIDIEQKLGRRLVDKDFKEVKNFKNWK